MKVGSLVKCIYGFCRERKYWPEVNFPVKGEVYTVEAIEPAATNCGKDDGITLYEIENKSWYHPNTGKPEPVWFWIKRFREVQPPMDLSFVEDAQMLIIEPNDKVIATQ